MKFITLVAALAAIPAALAANLTINTPSDVVECQPTQFQWTGGVAPYYLSLTPAAQTSAPAIKNFLPALTGTSYTWLVDLESGTSFTIVIKDSTGAQAFSDIVTIIAGTSSSCINLSVQESATGASGASSTGASAATSGTSTASSSSATQSSAAGHFDVSSAFGVAGVVGLLGAALF